MTSANTTNVVQAGQGTLDYSITANAQTSAFHDRGATRIESGTRVNGTDWILAFDLGIDMEFSDRSVVAFTPWVDDYAQGANQLEAVQNLLVSLAEFRESLERRAQRVTLSEQLADTLWKLQTLLVKG